jgi:phosphotransferase system enzyme I (PtsI)
MVYMSGIPASPGIAIAPARMIDRGKLKTPRRRILPDEVDLEVNRLMEAVVESRHQIMDAREAVKTAIDAANSDHAMIFDSHLLMLEDDLLVAGAAVLTREKLINAEWAVLEKIEEFRNTIAGLGNEFLRERAEDVAFVGNRIIRNLMGYSTQIIDEKIGPCIIVAETLSPAETTELIGTPVLGFATDTGTRTSHTAIMAQALGIPAVVGLVNLSDRLRARDTVIVDGSEGIVIIRPDSSTLDDYRGRAERYAELEQNLMSRRDEPATTIDGARIRLMCNVEFPAEAAMALDYGAEGVGLYRTEFLYLNRQAPPTEEEQYESYKALISVMGDKPVVIRTFDLGADKININGPTFHEINPAMGLRAVRLGVKYPEMFKKHLRAILRASNHGNIRVMFPMISGVSEMRMAKALLDEARLSLGDAAPSSVKVGCMIELPSAVFTADMLAEEADFFSIGTNDLIQYSLAIDRVNDHVAYLYTPFHPGILRAVKTIIDAGNKAQIPVSMCGNMAAEPLLIPLLIGFGLNTLSMAAGLIPVVKALIRSFSLEEARVLASRALELRTASEVEEMVRAAVGDRLNLSLSH